MLNNEFKSLFVDFIFGHDSLKIFVRLSSTIYQSNLSDLSLIFIK